LKASKYTVRYENTPKFIDHNMKADNQILIIFGTTMPDITCHQTIIQISTSPNICFCTT